ncbi:MAG: hypothetical protein SGARI_001397 [Bacillariaceae sp.]
MNSSFGDNNQDIAGKWKKAPDSFKKNKLRVSSRDELKNRREREEKLTPKGTSDAKSYLKSRRQKARDERRQNIMGILDDNLDKLDTEITNSPRHQKKNSLHHSHSSPKSKSSTVTNNNNNNTHTSKPTSPKSILRAEKSGTTNRLRALNPFRSKSKNDRRDQLKRSKSGRRISQRRKEQKEAIESVKQSKEKKNDNMQDILDEVLRKYPKEKCRTFADHKEFAFAELTVVSNEKRDFHVDAKKFNDLKSMLQTQLTEVLGEDDSVADSAKIDESAHRHSQRQSHLVSSPLRNRRLASPPGSPANIGSPNTRQHSSISPHKRSSRTSPRQSMAHRQSQEEASPQRSRTVVPSPPLIYSPQKSRNRVAAVASPRSNRPKSSQSLQLPTPRTTSMRLGPFIEKDEHTVTTENDDESTLDPNGQVGKYTGTIDVNTGLPQGSGRAEYEDGGTYHGDFVQGNWSGHGRHSKPNGDVYEGNYFENARHGMGTYRYRDGKRVFEGRYVMGQRVDGKMTYGDGSVYKGQWYDGKRHGRGTYRFKDSSVYKGEFVQDVIHGVGQLVWPDGAKYIGEWSSGHRHGLGKEYTADGRMRYEGKWRESIPIS